MSTTSENPATSSISASLITYSNSQIALITQKGLKAGFPRAFVPRKGFNSQFISVKFYTTTPVYPKILPKKVLMLTYNNFIIQEAGKPHSFGNGGDRVTDGTVALTIPGSGSQTPFTGTWTTTYGRSGKNSTMTFEMGMGGAYYIIGSQTLSQNQVDQIVESLSET